MSCTHVRPWACWGCLSMLSGQLAALAGQELVHLDNSFECALPAVLELGGGPLVLHAVITLYACITYLFSCSQVPPPYIQMSWLKLRSNHSAIYNSTPESVIGNELHECIWLNVMTASRVQFPNITCTRASCYKLIIYLCAALTDKHPIIFFHPYQCKKVY